MEWSQESHLEFRGLPNGIDSLLLPTMWAQGWMWDHQAYWQVSLPTKPPQRPKTECLEGLVEILHYNKIQQFSFCLLKIHDVFGKIWTIKGAGIRADCVLLHTEQVAIMGTLIKVGHLGRFVISLPVSLLKALSCLLFSALIDAFCFEWIPSIPWLLRTHSCLAISPVFSPECLSFFVPFLDVQAWR